MRRFAVTLLALTAVASSARAQNAGPASPGTYAPNPYNRQTQPLSPYLNLLRGGNQAVNYFYGVRQGTGAGILGATSPAAVGPRPPFFQVVDTLADLLTERRAAPRGYRRPATGRVWQHDGLLRQGLIRGRVPPGYPPGRR